MSNEVSPFVDYPDFFEQGEPPCASSDPDLFFPDAEMPNAAMITRMAKQVCSECPYVNECLEWALKADERIGIWGGTTAAERRRMKRGVVLQPPKKWSGK